MGDIRKQSIFSSGIIYFGFVFGFINSVLLAREGLFTPDQNGLIQLLINLGLISISFAGLGIPTIIGRFYPYYFDELSKKENDLLGMSLLAGLAGFVLYCLGLWLFEPLFVRKFSERSVLFIHYYYLLIPYTLFFLLFTILETYSFVNKRSVLPTFLRETGFRIYLSILILLYMINVIPYNLFVIIFSFNFALLSLILLINLYKRKLLNLVFKPSKVTFAKKNEMLRFIAFIYAGNILIVVAQNFDLLSISSATGLSLTGVYAFSRNISNLMQIPQRGLVNIAIPYVSQAWKDNNLEEIKRIYVRSAINLLLFALLIYFNILLTVEEVYKLFKLNPAYFDGITIVYILGLALLVDLGTGINSHMLYTSPNWKFEYLLALISFFAYIPINIYLVKNYGIIGSAYSTLGLLVAQNTIRAIFIYRKFNLHPFSKNYFISIAMAVGFYFIAYLLFRNIEGIIGAILRSVLFSSLFISAVYYFKLSPDPLHLVDTIKKRISKNG